MTEVTPDNAARAIRRWDSAWDTEFVEWPIGDYVLYSDHTATVTALEAEVERLRVIEEAARVYYREYCQDEAGDEPDDDGRGLWTGASAKQINDAATLRDALTGAGEK